MNAEGLLGHYERIADAPDAIVRLRRFVLDLAVRGKLVEQDAGEGSASKLLAKISIDSVHTRAKRKCNDGDAVLGRGPFRLPDSWAWVKLGTIARYGNPAKVNSNTALHESTWVLDLEDIEKSTGRLLRRMDSLARPFQSSKTHFDAGDVLFGKLRPYLCKVLVAAEPGVCTTEIVPISPAEGISPRFLELVLRSPLTMSKVDQLMYGVKMPRLGTSDANRLLFPLPPSEEQHRIVAKVEELMALCDQLEAARAQREATRDQLAAASLARLNAPDPATFPADARFALDTLPALTTRPDQIKQLRQTILNLAVRGKLVPQEPSDEPASALLNAIAKAKAKAKLETGDARIKAACDPEREDIRMTLPHGWCVQSFENLFLFVDYRGKTPTKTSAGIPLITAKNIRMGFLSREPREFISKKTFDGCMTRGLPKHGDIFFTTEAPLGNVCLNNIEEPFAMAQRAICLQSYGHIDTKFMMFSLMSDLMQSSIEEQATGMTAKGIKASKLKPLPLPVPPLLEQHRIVAKVDELMALCDQLEASLASGETTRRRLLDALLHEALAPVSTPSSETPRAAVSG